MGFQIIRSIIRSLFFTILIFILAFYYNIFFIYLKKVSECNIQTPISWPHLFNNRTFNRNFNIEFRHFMVNNFIGILLKLSSNLVVYSNFNNRIAGDRALRGKSGFFFYIYKKDGDNLNDFLKNNKLSLQQLDKATKKVKDIMNLCSSLNISFLLIIGPNKHSVYSEYYPCERPIGITRADQLSQIFNKINVTYIFPRDYLIKQKKKTPYPLYYETDTHWNSMGAFYVSLLVKEKIKKFFPKINFPEVGYQITAKLVRGQGDIVSMSPLINRNKTWCTIVNFYPKNGTNYANYTKIKNGRDIRTIGIDKSLPKAVIYRDSYFTALEPFISPLFSNAEYLWRKFDKSHFLKTKPDIMIFEMVERHSGYFF